MAELDALDASVAPTSAAQQIVIRGHSTLLSHAIPPALAFARSAWIKHSIDLKTFEEPGADGEDGRFELQISETIRDAWVARELFVTRKILCASPGYLSSASVPLETRDLTSHILIAVRGEPLSSFAAIDSSKIRHPTIVAHNVQAAAMAAEAGLGIALLPDYAVASALAKGRLAQVFAKHVSAAVMIQASHRVDAAPVIVRLAEALAGALKNGVPNTSD